VVEQMMFTALNYLPQTPPPPFDLKQFQHMNSNCWMNRK